MPLNTTAAMELVLFCYPNTAVVGYRVTNLTTAAVVSGTLSANLPANTTFLSPIHWLTNNAAATSVIFGFYQCVTENDF
jgi:hypothetical protein